MRIFNTPELPDLDFFFEFHFRQMRTILIMKKKKLEEMKQSKNFLVSLADWNLLAIAYHRFIDKGEIYMRLSEPRDAAEAKKRNSN